ncbi:unnamed protein product [Rotaria sp. Silwood1]|nr:unnamed protein product [Rotaria sp. Silwood1]
MFAYSGENLTKRLRSEAFRAILRQEINYFEQPKHSTGVLCTRLATEASATQGVSGIRFGFFCQNFVSIGMGIIVGFVFSWQLTLLMIAFFPATIIGTYLQICVTAAFERKDQKFIEDAGKVIVETIQNIRTVAQLTKETHFYNEYSHLLDIIYRSPDYGKAIEAAQRIFELLNRKPMINNESNDGDEVPNFSGQLEFDGAYFIYPNRPESIILRNFRLNIKADQKIALVGKSGCGKSTTIQLIERFYDANIGRLLADSKDVRSLNLQWYRSQISIVSQEPILFDMSIRENIAYGDNSRKDIPLDEIIEAAKNSNIHNFIQNLPNGYETNCGPKGIQLSGGQKQRIAIARALIRNPKILLLDEATSALDSESEKLVQEALDRAQVNRTSITVAHRLSTIQKADMICVMHNGIIVEHGTHEELFALGGRYYRLVQGKLK